MGSVPLREDFIPSCYDEINNKTSRTKPSRQICWGGFLLFPELWKAVFVCRRGIAVLRSFPFQRFVSGRVTCPCCREPCCDRRYTSFQGSLCLIVLTNLALLPQYDAPYQPEWSSDLSNNADRDNCLLSKQVVLFFSMQLICKNLLLFCFLNFCCNVLFLLVVVSCVLHSTYPG